MTREGINQILVAHGICPTPILHEAIDAIVREVLALKCDKCGGTIRKGYQIIKSGNHGKVAPCLKCECCGDVLLGDIDAALGKV